MRDWLEDNIPTLAERLGEAGYRSAGISNVSFVGPQWRLHRGFERWSTHDPDQSAQGASARVTGDAIRAVGEAAGERLFLFSSTTTTFTLPTCRGRRWSATSSASLPRAASAPRQPTCAP